MNNKPNKVNIGVGNNTVNNKPNKPVNNKPNKVNIGVGNNTVNNKNNNGNTIMTNANANNKNNNGNTIMTNANNKNNKNNNGNTIMTNANNKNNNGNTIMTNANSNVKPNNGKLNIIEEEPNKENAAVQNNARRNEENRKKAENAKKREEIEAKKEAAREEIRRRQQELKNKREESKRISNIEKNLLQLPNVDKVYLTTYRGNKSVENVNKNALLNKVEKDKLIRNLRNQLNPSMFGKSRISFIASDKYNNTKRNLEEKLKIKQEKKNDIEALRKLSVNAAVSMNYVKAFAGETRFVNVSLNALKNKRNKDLEIYKLNATDKKTMFGGYSTTVPGTKTMKFVSNNEYNKSLNRAKAALQVRRNAKQLAENKLKPKPANNNAKPNNNANNTKPNNNIFNINAELKKLKKDLNNTSLNNRNKQSFLNRVRNGNKNINTIKKEIKLLNNQKKKRREQNIENNRRARNENEENFNAGAELNKQLNIESNRQVRNENEKNFNASAELNKQLNIESNRQARNENEKNFNAAAELNKQLNNTSKNQLETKRVQVKNKAFKHVAGRMGSIGKWRIPIKNANLNSLNILDKNLDKRIELSREISISKVPSKRELMDKTKQFLMNVKNLRRIFEKELNNIENKKVSNVTRPLVKGAINKAVIEKKRALLKKKANDEIGGAFFFGGIGKWETPIRNAKTENAINKLNDNLNERIKLRRNIKSNRNLNKREKDKINSNVMKFDVKISNLRKNYENARNKKISNTTGPLVKGILNKAVANNKRGSFNGGLRLGNNNNNIYPNSNNNVKPNMKPNPTFEPNMENNPTFEVFENKKPNNKPKITNENLRPMKSAIGGLKQLPKNKKSGFESRLNAAFKNQNLNKMKAIRNEAIAANKTIQNKLAEEKRLKEEAKEAQRKKEAENAARRKAEREAKKKAANNMKRQLNAANNILNLANKALKKKENNKAPTLMERGSYTSKINTQMKKLAKGTTNRVREDWEKKKRVFKGRITKAATIGQVKKAYENAKAEYNKLK